jgi:hypothetical protein
VRRRQDTRTRRARGGNAGTCTQLSSRAAALQAAPVSLPSTFPGDATGVGWPTGLAPVTSRVTVSCLELLWLRPQSAREDLHLQPLAYREGRAEARAAVRDPVPRELPAKSMARDRPRAKPGSQPTESDRRARGYGPRRCPARAAKTRTQSARSCHREDSNLCPQPSQSCVPSLERWRGRSGGNRTPRSFAPTNGSRARLARTIGVSPEITAVSVAGLAPASPVRETGELATVRHGQNGRETGNAFRPSWRGRLESNQLPSV